jgi:predicted porin
MQIQKKIIALAITSALATPALALADATIYGQTNLSVDMVNNGANTNGTTANKLDSNTSRLGVKGSEDLGGGMSMTYQAEGTLLPDSKVVTYGGTTTSAFAFDRDTFIGLGSASMGTLMAGQHDSPYKMATRRLDVFGDGIADNRGDQSSGKGSSSTILGPFSGTMMGGGHDARLGNVLAYVSPNLNGVTIAAATVFGAEAVVNSTQTKGSAMSLAGMYEQGPIYVALAYDTITYGSAATGDLAPATGYAANDKSTATKLGGSYTTDQFGVNLVLEKISNTIAPAASADHNNMYLAGKFNISSSDAVKLAYTKIGDVTGTTSGAKQTTLGYDHSMSKVTTVYALYSKLSPDTSGAASPSVLSLGVKHSF